MTVCTTQLIIRIQTTVTPPNLNVKLNFTDSIDCFESVRIVSYVKTTAW